MLILGILWNSFNVVFLKFYRQDRIRHIRANLHAFKKILETNYVKRFNTNSYYTVILLFITTVLYTNYRITYYYFTYSCSEYFRGLCLGTMGRMFAIYGTVAGPARRSIADLESPLIITQWFHVPTILGMKLIFSGSYNVYTFI